MTIFKFKFRRATLLSIAFFTLFLFACNKDNFQPVTPPDDGYKPNYVQFNYDGDRKDIAGFYQNNLMDYWAQFGFPPLANLSQILAEMGDSYPWSPFANVQAAFSQDMFFNALEHGQLPPPVAEAYLSSPSSNPWNAVLKSIIQYGQQLRAAEANGDISTIGQIHMELRQLAMAAFNPDALLALSTIADKGFDILPPSMLNIDVCFRHAHGYESFEVETGEGGVADTTKAKWTDITGILWKTDYNGACGTVATGACANKLGLIDDTADCKEWDDLSKGIGAKKGKMGATVDGIESWFKGKGYGRTNARDKAGESAVEEAQKALKRGCDVMLWYKNGDKAGHIETVTDVEVDAGNSKKGKLKTISWGQSGTTAVESGKGSGKSDGSRYRQAGEAASWLEGTFDAEIIYFCKD